MSPAAILEYRLLAAPARQRMAAFDSFVRAARAITDDADRAPDERFAALEAMAVDVTDGGEHARHILQGLRKEVMTTRYRNWSELIAWCGYAAAPAGRYVLAVHGEGEEALRPVEALFSAARILLCVGGCRADYIERDRVYLPSDWLRRAGVEAEMLAAREAAPGLRSVLDQALDGIDRLLTLAGGAPAAIHDPGLRRAVARALGESERLARKLRRRDPLAGAVTLGQLDRWIARWRARRR